MVGWFASAAGCDATRRTWPGAFGSSTWRGIARPMPRTSTLAIGHSTTRARRSAEAAGDRDGEVRQALAGQHENCGRGREPNLPAGQMAACRGSSLTPALYAKQWARKALTMTDIPSWFIRQPTRGKQDSSGSSAKGPNERLKARGVVENADLLDAGLDLRGIEDASAALLVLARNVAPRGWLLGPAAGG